MLTSSLQITISLRQPLYLRVWHRLTDAALAAWRAALQAPCVLARHAPRHHAWSELSGLSAHTLKDIGAPDWAVLEAAARRDLARQRLDEFSGWRGV